MDVSAFTDLRIAPRAPQRPIDVVEIHAHAARQLPVQAQRVEPVTALCRDSLQIVQVAGDERWALRARRNDENVTDSSREGNWDQNLHVLDRKKLAQWIAVIDLSNLTVGNPLRPGQIVE